MTFDLDIEKYAYPDLKPMQQDARWAHRYCYDIIKGNIPSCKKMKWAAMRHFRDLERDDVYWDHDAADSIVLWFKFCPIIKGTKAGSPTILDPSQIFILCSLISWLWSDDLFEVDKETGQSMQVRHANKRRYNQFYGQVSRKYGKALALDTKIPTPDGWTTMGDLQEGDRVFDEKGNVCNVTDVTDIQHNRNCYKLTFSNGEKVVADADHQWETRVYGRKGIRTTQDIFETLTGGKRGDFKHHVDFGGAFELPDIELPIDPYVLGYWLGDGHVKSNRVTVNREHFDEVLSQFNSRGFTLTKRDNGKGHYVCTIQNIDGTPYRPLLSFNATKRIPDEYLRSSKSQRISLLQGLLDTDGSIDIKGKGIEFSQKDGHVSAKFGELLSSLGIKYKANTKFVPKYPNTIYWRFTFCEFSDGIQCFTLQHKLERMRKTPTKRARCKSVTIIGCEPVESVPVKCIAVDSPNKLYRFGETAIVTHNTTLMAGLKLYLMYKYKYGARVFSLATKKDQAKEVWNVAKKMISLSPRLRTIFEPRANDILLPKKQGEFKPLASDSNSLDGLDPMAACLDECHAIKDRNLYGVMISAFGSNEGGEYLFSIITTAGFILDGLCTDIYKNGERVLDPSSDVVQDNYFYCIFEIDKDDSWEEESSWYKSNPALVYGRPSIQYMRDRFNEAKLSVEEKANFLTKHCNLFVNPIDVWLNIDEVKACSNPELQWEDYQHKTCYVGIDRALVSDITALPVLFPDDDGGCTVFPFNLQSRGAVDEAGDYLRSIYAKAEASEDLEVLNGNTVRDNDVKEMIRYLWAELPNCKGFYYDPWHMREIAQDLEEEGIPMIAVSQGTGNMSEPAKKLEGLIKEGLFRYNGSVLFEYATMCAMTGVSKMGNMMVFRDASNTKTDKIDPLIATIIALSGATLMKPDQFIYNDRGMVFI